MSPLLHVLLVFLLIDLARPDPIPFENCGFQYDLLQVNVHGCTEVPCPVLQDSYNNVTTTFRTNQAAISLSSDVRIILFNVQNAADTLPSNPCLALEDASCPLSSNVLVEHTAQFYVKPNLLPTRGSLQWKMYNEHGTEVLCFRVAVRIIGTTSPDTAMSSVNQSTPQERRHAPTKISQKATKFQTPLNKKKQALFV